MKVSSLLLFLILYITSIKSTITSEPFKEGRFYQINSIELFREIVENSTEPFFLKFYQYKRSKNYFVFFFLNYFRLQCESVEKAWK